MAKAVAPSAELPQGARTRVLIVPDDLLAHELGGSLLDRHALRVRAARDAEDALAINAAWRPHLIVLRSRIAGVPAAPLCHALGSVSDERPRLVLVTDSVGERMGDAADSLCDAHLVSPVDVDQIVSTIAELLELRVRRSSRAPIDALVHTEGFLADKEPSIDACLGTALNVSEDGLLLESGRPLPVGSAGKLLFFLPGVNERLALQGVVRMAVDEVRLWFAIELIDLAPHHRTLIRRYVQQTLDPQP